MNAIWFPGRMKMRFTSLAIAYIASSIATGAQTKEEHSTPGSPINANQVASAKHKAARQADSRTRVTGTRTASASILRSTKAKVVENYGKLPMRFEVNQGQTDANVKFLVRGRGYSLFLTGSEAVVALKKPLPINSSATPPTNRAVSTSLHMRLSGANPNATLDALRYRSAKRRVDPPENFEKQETECTQICLRKTW
jgi:hypothetical protein